MWDLSFSALNEDSGFWPRLQRRCYGGFRRLSGLSQRFWLSRAYFPFLLWVALGFAALRQPVYGAMALLGICIWLLVFCRDLLASVTPFLLVFLLSTQRYESLGDFLPCAVLAAPFFAALIWHLMVWPVTFRVGRSATGLLLVSAATLLGGCGILSMHQLLQPLSLYYVGCLGGGMLVFYVLLRSCLTYSKGYDLHRRFAAIFCVLGVCMACLVMLDYAVRWQEFLQVHTTLYLKYRNFATALLLTTLPMSFYLSLKKPAHLLGVAVQAAGLALTGSRSALLFGAALLGLGFVYLVRWGLIPRKAVLPLCVAGAVLAVLVWRTDLRGISNFSTALLVIDLIVIFSPKIPGLSYTGGLGMTGWIKIPGIGLTFQPVELAKLITIFFIATLGSQYNGRIDTARDYVKLCGMLSIPFLAVVAMGDLGSGLVVLVSGAIVICMSGARREWVLSTLALLVGLVALVLALDSVFDSLLGHDVLIKQYQMNRLTVFIDPDNADSDDAYNLQQSLIAVGSGGFFGKGLGHATQSAGGFLPEFHTDFVFAFLSETFGFCGSFLLLCLYVLLIFSTIRVAFKCESLFLRLSCVGIVGMWAFQTFENIGMCIGMMPITGIPLPFISFGSSSMMIQLLTVGIVQSIWRHRSGAA